jgi:hypothetical protein
LVIFIQSVVPRFHEFILLVFFFSFLYANGKYLPRFLAYSCVLISESSNKRVTIPWNMEIFVISLLECKGRFPNFIAILDCANGRNLEIYMDNFISRDFRNKLKYNKRETN